jgi:hypothetical protein
MQTTALSGGIKLPDCRCDDLAQLSARPQTAFGSTGMHYLKHSIGCMPFVTSDTRHNGYVSVLLHQTHDDWADSTSHHYGAQLYHTNR